MIEAVREIQFVPVQEEHLPAIREIYNYYVEHTTVSFHTIPLGLDEIRSNVIHRDPRYCTFVIVSEGAVQGYALLTQHKNKQAYDVTAEVTLYLAPGAVGLGIGSRSIALLEAEARERDFHVLIATICTENEPSIRLFKRHGYEQCAHFKEIGRKFGRKLDIASYQKIIGS